MLRYFDYIKNLFPAHIRENKELLIFIDTYAVFLEGILRDIDKFPTQMQIDYMFERSLREFVFYYGMHYRKDFAELTDEEIVYGYREVLKRIWSAFRARGTEDSIIKYVDYSDCDYWIAGDLFIDRQDREEHTRNHKDRKIPYENEERYTDLEWTEPHIFKLSTQGHNLSNKELKDYAKDYKRLHSSYLSNTEARKIEAENDKYYFTDEFIYRLGTFKLLTPSMSKEKIRRVRDVVPAGLQYFWFVDGFSENTSSNRDIRAVSDTISSYEPVLKEHTLDSQEESFVDLGCTLYSVLERETSSNILQIKHQNMHSTSWVETSTPPEDGIYHSTPYMHNTYGIDAEFDINTQIMTINSTIISTTSRPMFSAFTYSDLSWYGIEYISGSVEFNDVTGTQAGFRPTEGSWTGTTYIPDDYYKSSFKSAVTNSLENITWGFMSGVTYNNYKIRFKAGRGPVPTDASHLSKTDKTFFGVYDGKYGSQITLRGIPCDNNKANYVDENNQKWLSDYIDFENQVIYRYCFEHTFKKDYDSQQWVLSGNNTIFIRIDTEGYTPYIVSTCKGLCNYFEPTSALVAKMSDLQYRVSGSSTNNNNYFRYDELLSESDPLEAWKSWIDNHKVKVIWGTTIPVVEHLPEGLFPQIKARAYGRSVQGEGTPSPTNRLDIESTVYPKTADIYLYNEDTGLYDIKVDYSDMRVPGFRGSDIYFNGTNSIDGGLLRYQLTDVCHLSITDENGNEL